jgi:tetratricopeptide (TPR) repeat protein
MRGRRIGEFVGHQDWIRGMAFAPNGEFFVTGSSDNTARIWKVESLEDLLVRGCAWLNDYLIKTPTDLMELETCQTDERIIAAAPELVKQGEKTAKGGNVEVAIALFQQALEWDTELGIEPAIYAEQFQIIGEGEVLAQAGEVQPAIDQFEAAIALDETLDLNPESYALDLAIPALIDQIYWLSQQGSIDAGLAALEKVKVLEADQEIAPYVWDALCWYGSLHNQAAKVIEACDTAVQLTPERGAFRDSRGIARALTGNIEGAIADLEFYIEIEHPSYEKWISQRQQWVDALEAGENPFTPEVLESLQ